jgi:hypothetical protein
MNGGWKWERVLLGVLGIAGTLLVAASQVPAQQAASNLASYAAIGLKPCSTVFRAPNGTIKEFDPPNSTYTRPEGIAKHAAVAGYFSDTSGVYHGFLRGE